MQAVPKMSRWLFPFILFILLLPGCRDKNAFVAPPPPTVTVMPPVQKAVTFYAQYTGQTEAVESVEIRARVEGYLQSIHFRDADQVKKGDLLFVIDPRPYQARLDETRALLATRRAELHLAEATLKRKESAFQDQAVSEVEVIEARAIRDQALAAIEAARAAVETARLDLSYTRIFAPISGRIGRRLVDVGNLVGAAEKTLLATIVNVEPSYVYFNINERDLLKFQNGHPDKLNPTNGNGETPIFLGLSNDSGYPREGRVDFTDNRVDPETGTIQVRGVFPNSDGNLLPGLFARVQIPVGLDEESLLVPERALGIDQQGYYLLAVDKTDTVEYRPVKVGPQVEEMRVIESGVSVGDRIVVNGLQRARPGITVHPVAPSEANASLKIKSPQAG
jgi:RND family efflux transporter MFP subunit